MTTVSVKSGDTGHEFTSTLTVDGVAENLAGCTVLFCMSDGTTSHALAATIVNAAAGTVKYVPGAGYPTTPGRYEVEWEVTYGDATKLTFPNDGYHVVKIFNDLN